MKSKQQKSIKSSLRKTMKNWIEQIQSQQIDDCLPFWIGDNMSDLMADAAMNVLLSSEDVQKYLKREGYLKEG